MGTNSSAFSFFVGLNATSVFVQYLASDGSYPTTTTAPVTTGAWHHVWITYSQSAGITFYLNGHFVGTTVGMAFQSTPNMFRMGAYAHNLVGAAFNGYIDDFRIWNSVITTPPMVKLPWTAVSMSGSGSYFLATNNFGQVFQSANEGSTWTHQSTVQTIQSATTDLPLSYSGQYQATTGSQVVTPNKSSLADYTWHQNGTTWTVSHSSVYNPLYSYYAFNNITTGSGWGSATGKYNGGSGAYNGGTASTTLQGIGAVGGEYIQLQSSIPLVLQSHRLASGGTVNYLPKTYYIAGSTDGITWYPLTYVTLSSNPFNATNTAWVNNILTNYTGTQAVRGNLVVSATTQSYSASNQAFSYFRLIVTSNFSVDLAEIGELYPVFTTGLAYSTNSGSTYTPMIAYGDTFNVTKALTITSAGTGYATLPSYTYAGTGLTFAAWFYLTGAPVQYTRIVDIGTSYNEPQSSIHLYFSPTGTLIAGTKVTGATTYMTGTTACAQNTLYHVALTITTAGVHNLYINGFVDATPITVAPANTTYISNFVGRSNWASDATGNEYIVDFRMFNRALSATEVATLAQANNYNTGPALMEPLAISGNGNYSVGGAGNIVKVDASYLANTVAGTQTTRTLATTGSIISACISYTGQYMVVLVNTTTSNVWYSTNYGATWASTTAGSAVLMSCAMSYDGSYVTVSNATAVYTLNLNTKGYSVAMGAQAGLANQGQNAVAIGTQAAPSNQSANSIVINATGSAVNTSGAGFYVAPIAPDTADLNSSTSLLAYGTDFQIVKTSISVNSFMNPGTNPMIQFGPTNTLSSTASSYDVIQRWFQTVTNTHSLNVMTIRTAEGSDWTNSGMRIQNLVDASWSSYIQFNGSGNTHGISFGTGSNVSGPGSITEAMRITSAGYVGIGTTALHSQAILTLSGPNLQNQLHIDNRSGGTDGKNWAMGPNGNTFYIYTFNDAKTVSGNALQFVRSGNSIQSASFPSGNVGILTTIPGASLHVGGDATSAVMIQLNEVKIVGNSNSHWSLFGARSGRNYFSIANTSVNGAIGTAGTDVLSITSGNNIGIGTTNPGWSLDVYGHIAQSGYRLPRVFNASFSGSASVSVPIYFADTTYNYAEIKMAYAVSAICNINISSTNASSGALGFSECALTTVRWDQQATPTYTTFTNATSGLFANAVETVGITHNLIFRITRNGGGTAAGGRNHYSYDNTYCWAAVGTARGYGQGHIDSGDTPVAFVTLTCSAGTISGTYSTVHSY
jgi:hypothetical protein